MSATGDLKNNLLKTQSELRHIRYSGPFDIYSVCEGDPAAFLPIIHFILLDYSQWLAQHFAAKNYELYGKKDRRFMEAVYRLLRDEFGYKPQLTRDQFFSMGFAERKLIFISDLIRLSKTLQLNLSKARKQRKVKDTLNQENMAANGTPVREDESNARDIKGKKPATMTTSQTPLRKSARLAARYHASQTILPNNVAIVHEQYSPERRHAFRRSWNSPRGRNSKSPNPARLPLYNEQDSFHHLYHQVEEDYAGLGRSRNSQWENDDQSNDHDELPKDDPNFQTGLPGNGSMPTWEHHSALETTIRDQSIEISPPKVQRHYSRYRYCNTAAEEQTLSPPLNHQHPFKPTSQTEGNTIYEPAVPPIPAQPPPDANQPFDMSFQSQPSILKTTPIPKSGLDDTFLSEPSLQILSSSTKELAENSAEPDHPNLSPPSIQNASNHPPPPPPQDDQIPQRATRLQSSPQLRERPLVAGRDDSPPRFPFVSRAWVAPTAPPANPSPVPQPSTVAQQADLQEMFETFTRVFAAKEEEAAALRLKVEKLEALLEKSGLSVERRLSAVEADVTTLRESLHSTNSVKASRIEHVEANMGSTKISRVLSDRSDVAILPYAPDTVTNGVPLVDKSQECQSRTEMRSRSLLSPSRHDNASPAGHSADDSASGPVMAVHSSISSGSVLSKSAEHYVKSIQERMQHTSQLLKERARAPHK